MSSSSLPTHPLLRAVAAVHAVLDDVSAVDPDLMPVADRAAYLTQLARAVNRLQARVAQGLASADDVAERAGARSAAHWLAQAQRLQPGPLIGDEALGRRIREVYPALGAAFAEGRLTREHARAVVRALDALPAAVPGHEGPSERAALVAKAESHLVDEARHFRPRELRVLGRRLLEVLAPEAAEEVERGLLEREERAARRTTVLELHRMGDGTTRVRARIPDLDATILRKALEAYVAPRRRGGTDGASATTGERQTPAQRRGEAFCALLQHLPADGLPQQGGTPVSVVVTISETDLRRATGAASLDTGERMSVSQLRRLACGHRILPAVLGGRSEVLDLGRSRRLFSAAQRRAHLLRHHQCQAEGCDVPAAWTEAHHKRGWAEGGNTDLADLALLCFHHHQLAHDARWEVTWSSSGTGRFRRRQ